MSRVPLAAVAAACLAAAPAHAETHAFGALLGGSEIGSVSLDSTGDGEGADLALHARFAGTPLDVADGRYEATSRLALAPGGAPGGETVRQFLGRGDFTRGARTVSVLLDGGRAVGTTIEPAADLTELSEPARVPAGVLDPAQAFAALAEAGGCPAPFRLYDGRRVAEIDVAPTGGEGGDATCEGSYRVLAGPGHLSPLGISSLDLRLAYQGGALAEVVVRTGPFELRLLR